MSADSRAPSGQPDPGKSGAVTRIYFEPMPDGQQPYLDVDEPFQDVLGKFNPATVSADGYSWPVVPLPGGLRQALNPDHVTAIAEVAVDA